MSNISKTETVKVTSKGFKLLAKVQAGAILNFTRAVIGDGFMPEGKKVTDLNGLISEISSHQSTTNATSATVDLTKVEAGGDGTLKIRIKIKNGDTAFYMREIGIMANDPDEGEILYAYINFGDGASAMPAFDGTTYVVRNIQMSFIVSNAAKVEANITLTAEVSYDDFMSHKNANVLDHPDGCVTSEKLANGSVTGTKLAGSVVTLDKLNNDVHTKFDGLEKAIQKINSTKKIDLEYSISQGSSGYNIVVKPKVNYIERKEVSGTATYPTQSYDKCYMYICYDYDSDSISLICGTTVSGRGPQPPDNYIFPAEISSSSDCGNFEYHRLIQKDDNGDIVAVM